MDEAPTGVDQQAESSSRVRHVEATQAGRQVRVLPRPLSKCMYIVQYTIAFYYMHAIIYAEMVLTCMYMVLIHCAAHIYYLPTYVCSHTRRAALALNSVQGVAPNSSNKLHPANAIASPAPKTPKPRLPGPEATQAIKQRGKELSCYKESDFTVELFTALMDCMTSFAEQYPHIMAQWHGDDDGGT